MIGSEFKAFDDDVERSPPWLVSFGDVTALMLTFFVMLFSMSHLKSERWDDIISLINTSLQPKEVKQPLPTSERNVATVDILGGLSTDYLERILGEKLQRDPILAEARVTGLQEQVVVSIPSDALFLPGSAALSDGAEEALKQITSVMSQIGNHVDIVGHTDPSPIRSGAFRSNWELSLARALRVADVIRLSGYQGGFSAVGMGDSRYRRLDPELSEEERYALSRRVDIVFRAEAGGQ